MLKKNFVEYFISRKIENKRFWKRLGGEPNLKNKSILDFGCGLGSLCLDMATQDVKIINGIDLEDDFLKFANENLVTNYGQFKDKIKFEKKNLFNDKFDEKFDLIVSKDTFEHTVDLPKILDKFYDLLKKDGKVYIGFGPLYNSYNGDHGRTQLKFPWLHVILSEKIIIDRYNNRNSIKIKKIEDLGLSKYSFKEYKQIFQDSKFEIQYFKTNLSDHPIGKVFNYISKINILKEYFTFNIYCILKKY